MLALWRMEGKVSVRIEVVGDGEIEIGNWKLEI
jgi:hypothetical protein